MTLEITNHEIPMQKKKKTRVPWRNPIIQEWFNRGPLTASSLSLDVHPKHSQWSISNSLQPMYIYIYGSVSKPCTPVVHIKIAGIYGCSSL